MSVQARSGSSQAHTARTWDRVKEALRRDWEQTLFDLGLSRGHCPYQKLSDTIAQVAGVKPIPDGKQKSRRAS